jgi:hypothetical protein
VIIGHVIIGHVIIGHVIAGHVTIYYRPCDRTLPAM